MKIERDDTPRIEEAVGLEIQSLILQGSPSLRSRIRFFSNTKSVWAREGWKLFRLYKIVLTINLICLDDEEFQNIKTLVENHLLDLLKQPVLSGYGIEVNFERMTMSNRNEVGYPYE